MATEPLEVFFAMGGHRPRFLPSHTALRRGYVGGWEIAGGRLYLMKLTAELDNGVAASLETVFPGFRERVFAHWYTGTLRIPRGDRLRYVHAGYSSVYERDEMLEFQRGVVRRTWVRCNREGDAEGVSATTRQTAR